MLKLFATVSFCIVMFVLVHAEQNNCKGDALMNENIDAIQNILDSTIREHNIPGVQTALRFSDSSTILLTSGNVDNKDVSEVITDESIFRIGSATKMFVAVLICQLIQENKISLNDTINRWFPEIENSNTITIKELLNHTSGIEENLFTKPLILTKSLLFSKVVWNPEKVINDIIDGSDIVSRESRTFMYSNSNYILLGLIAEKIEKKTIAVQLKERFFTPLGMKNTYITPHYDSIPKNLIVGTDEYIPFGPHKIKPDNSSWSSLLFTAGAMASTAEDLTIFLDAYFHEKLVSKEMFVKMRNFINAQNNGRDEGIVGYGLGICQYEIDSVKMEGHPGGGFGGECYPFYIPEYNLSIAVSYNVSREDNPAGKTIVKKVVELFKGE